MKEKEEDKGEGGENPSANLKWIRVLEGKETLPNIRDSSTTTSSSSSTTTPSKDQDGGNPIIPWEQPGGFEEAFYHHPEKDYHRSSPTKMDSSTNNKRKRNSSESLSLIWCLDSFKDEEEENQTNDSGVNSDNSSVTSYQDGTLTRLKSPPPPPVIIPAKSPPRDENEESRKKKTQHYPVLLKKSVKPLVRDRDGGWIQQRSTRQSRSIIKYTCRRKRRKKVRRSDTEEGFDDLEEEDAFTDSDSLDSSPEVYPRVTVKKCVKNVKNPWFKKT